MSLSDLLEIGASFWRSAGDEDFHEEHFAERNVVLSTCVLDKRSVLATVSDAQPWDRFDIHDPSLIELGGKVEAATSRATGRCDENNDEYEANILSVYENEGDWQLVLHQQTTVDRS